MHIVNMSNGQSILMGLDSSKPFTHSVTVQEIHADTVHIELTHDAGSDEQKVESHYLERYKMMDFFSGNIFIARINKARTMCRLGFDHSPYDVAVFRSETYHRLGGFTGGKK
jgi:hypothetical protein